MAGTVAPETRAGGGGKDRSVETARGVACLLVVVFHVLGASSASGLALPTTNAWSYFGRSLDYVHMPAFAFLGGVAYGYSPLRRGQLVGFARKKALRIILPLFTVTTLYLAGQFVVTTSSVRPDPAWRAYVYPYLHLWYLQALSWLMVGVVVLDALRLLRGPLLGAVLVGFCYLFWHRAHLLPAEFGAILAGYLAPFFLAGLAWHRWGGIAREWAAPVFLTGTAALAVLVWCLLPQNDVPGWAAAVLRLVAGIGLTAGFLAARPDWRWAAWLGALSYPVYLYHVFGTAAARHALYGLGITEVWTHLLIGAAAGIGAGLAVRLVGRRVGAATGLPLGLALFGEARPERTAPMPLAAHVRPGDAPS